MSVDDIKTRIEAFIKEVAPSADVAPGSVIDELLVKLAASINTNLSDTITTIAQQRTISQVLSSSTPTFSSVIDGIASNYNVTRSTGTKSTGVIKITVDTQRNFLIPANLQFLQPSINTLYQTTSQYRVSSTPDEGELQLYVQGALYYFLLPVEAVDVGSAAQVSSRTPFQLGEGFTIASFVAAEAYGNFTTGSDAESDQTLITRFRTGLVNKGLLAPSSILANLQLNFPDVKNISVVGAGDAEMLRSKRNIMGISTFGVADVYVRSSFGLQTVTLTKAATKTGTGTWHMDLGADDQPGLYQVLSIRPLDSDLIGSLTITDTTFSYSVPTEQRVNQVTTQEDARFSIYQTVSVDFGFNETPGITVGATQDFEVVVSYQPLLTEIQDLFIGDDTRIACADYLVKAVLPCIVTLNIAITKSKPTDTIDTAAIQQAIFNYINSIPFGESLYASKIVDICHNFNIKNVDLPISMTGTVLANDGSSIIISDSDILTIPTDIDLGVSPKTTMFFVDFFTDGSDNIGITVS